MSNQIINKKWTIQLLLFLHCKNQISYKSIKNSIQIPNSTLALRLNELVKYNFIEKFVYGPTNKPHSTEYKITTTGLDHINNLFPFD